MNLELRWIAGVSVSAFHAACALASGRTLVDATLAEPLAGPTQALIAAAGLTGQRQDALLTQLAALSGGIENNSQLAEVALTKTLGRGQVSPTTVRELAGAIAELESALRRARPSLLDELAMRGEPLRQQWEARGPGLWRLVGQRTEAALLVERADVFLVLPVLGGGGAAHWQTNTVRFEAVLANPLFALPESLRLAWLLSQLQLDLPLYAERMAMEKWARVVALVTIPVILSCGEEVELTRYDLATLALAIEHWTAAPTDEAQRLAKTLDAWWNTYQAARPRFDIALAALAEMLP